MKIAFLKQDTYQDLYIGDKSFSAADILFTSIMRVGPIGLLYDLKADFYIIKEAEFPECKIWEKILPETKHRFIRQLKNKSMFEIDKNLVTYIKPGSNESHDRYSISYKDVSWDYYDMVISINIAVPTKVVKKYPDTLWCYMIGEANKFVENAYFGYDIVLNQLTRGLVSFSNNVIDFPYTFVQKDTLQKIIHEKEGIVSNQRGIYLEINTSDIRPVIEIPEFKILKETGHPIILHKPSLYDNLYSIYHSKYFIKVGGRLIRGNSVIESISLGTLVLMNPEDLIHTQILPKECWVYTIEDVLRKINYLENNPVEYERLLQLQKELLQLFIFDLPLESLKLALERKRQFAIHIKKSNEINKLDKLLYYLRKLFYDSGR